jgi:hypothetical protein
MSASWSDQKITEFVRSVLGCGCPDEVFEKIQVSGIQLAGFTTDVSRIDIGNTLLIYVVRPASNAQLREAISAIVKAAKADRDGNGFNRFRCVVVGNEKDLEFVRLRSLFADEIAGDEKMHLHIVLPEDISGL